MSLKIILIISILILSTLITITIPQNPTTETDTEINIYFCPKDSCSKKITDLIKSSNESVYCALYDLELDNMINALKNKNYQLIVDKTNTKDIENRLTYLKNDNTHQLMHNKFCIIDKKIIVTGSMNPTLRGDTKNNNNLVIIKSRYMAQNYLDEFKELRSGTFGKGKETKHQILHLNNTKVENYFCPEDSCAQHVIDTINKAEKSIDFMTFSFTHDQIGDAIINQHNNNIKIRGIFETTQNNKWTEYEKLKSERIDVRWDNNPYNMHNKVFIIDNEIVITGSFNPTKSGDERNDENILIIHDKEIANKYTEEFNKILNPQ